MGWKRLRLRLAISGIAFAPLSLYISIYLCTNPWTQLLLLQTTMHAAACRPALSGFIARLRGTCFTMQVQT